MAQVGNLAPASLSLVRLSFFVGFVGETSKFIGLARKLLIETSGFVGGLVAEHRLPKTDYNARLHPNLRENNGHHQIPD